MRFLFPILLLQLLLVPMAYGQEKSWLACAKALAAKRPSAALLERRSLAYETELARLAGLPPERAEQVLRERWHDMPPTYSRQIKSALETWFRYWGQEGDLPENELALSDLYDDPTALRAPPIPVLMAEFLSHSAEEIPIYRELGALAPTAGENGKAIGPSDVTQPELEEEWVRSLMIVIGHVRSGALKPSETIVPGLAFQRKRSGLRVYVNPALEDWPDPSDWDLIETLPQIQHAEEWMPEISYGVQPVSLQPGFHYHDVYGHYVPLLLQAERMRALRAHQREYLRASAWAHSSAAGAGGIAVLAGIHHRNIDFAEFGVTANPRASSADLAAVLGDWCDQGKCRATDYREQMRWLAKLPKRDLSAVALSVARRWRDLISMDGAAMRDHNLYSQGVVQVHPYLTASVLKRELVLSDFVTGGTEQNRVSMLQLETLWGVGIQAQALYDALFGMSGAAEVDPWNDSAVEFESFLNRDPSRRAFAKALLLDRVARFRAGVATGLARGVDAVKVIIESAGAYVPPGSGLYEFDKSYLAPESYRWLLGIEVSKPIGNIRPWRAKASSSP